MVNNKSDIIAKLKAYPKKLPTRSKQEPWSFALTITDTQNIFGNVKDIDFEQAWIKISTLAIQMGHAKSWDNLFKPQTKKLRKYRRLKTYCDRSSGDTYFKADGIIKMLEDRPIAHIDDLKKQLIEAVERAKATSSKY